MCLDGRSLVGFTHRVVFIGPRPSLPLNLSLPHGHGRELAPSASLQNLVSSQGKPCGGLAVKREGNVSTEGQAENDFSTEFI